MQTETIDDYLSTKSVVEKVARKVLGPTFQETSASDFHKNLDTQQSNDWKHIEDLDSHSQDIINYKLSMAEIGLHSRNK